MKNIFFVLLLVICASCTKTTSPEKALKEFVDYRFSIVQTKDWLLAKTVGPFNQRIAEMGPESFAQFIDTKPFKKRRFSILSNRCTDVDCFVTYILVYDNFRDSILTATTEVKKVAQVRLVDGEWRIFDISNVKTYLDMKEPIVP